MSEYTYKRHNVSVLLSRLVCPATYRRVVFDTEVDTVVVSLNCRDELG